MTPRRRHPPLRFALAAAVCACAASAAHAEGPPLSSLPIHAAPEALPEMDLAIAGTPHAPTFAQANALRAAGVARTALDHRFSRADEVVGSVGFLCGLHENLDNSGGARLRLGPPRPVPGRQAQLRLPVAKRPSGEQSQASDATVGCCYKILSLLNLM